MLKDEVKRKLIRDYELNQFDAIKARELIKPLIFPDNTNDINTQNNSIVELLKEEIPNIEKLLIKKRKVISQIKINTSSNNLER